MITQPPRLRGRVLRAGFNLLYHQFAWGYDWVSRAFFRNQWRNWQRSALPQLRGIPGREVLEIGCGTGDLQFDLRRAGFVPFGADLSAPMLRQALGKERRRNSPAPLQLVRARTQALPFADASFAAVVSTFPSEYIADPATSAEIGRVLQPGGRLVVVPGARLLPTDRTNRLLERFAGAVYGDNQRREQAIEQAMRERMFPTLLDTLAAAGLTLVHHGWLRRRESVVYIIVAAKVSLEV